MSSTNMIDDGFFHPIDRPDDDHPGEQLKAGEMRISFMGTSVIQRRTQVCSSVFVELGIEKIDDKGNPYVWVESFVFDCGAGCTVNYTAMQVPMSRMRKIFLTHLHGDHTSDLTHIYGFGPQQDGKSPLYIYGPSASLVPDPKTGRIYDDGTINFCYHFWEMNRWHTEAQSFVGTQWCATDGDGYEIRATELNWRTGGKRTWNSTTPYPGPDKNPCGSGSNSYPKMAGVAYEENGVRISFFPALHDRNGSISYKLEWNGLSMIFTGDTQPNNFLIDQACSGVSPVDVLISEMVVPTEVWAAQGSQDTPSDAALKLARTVQKNSHTPEKAFGFILQQLKARGKAPRLAVATHFQAENQGAGDDTITPASNAIRSFYPDGDVVIATDLMVINVLPNPNDPKQPFIRHRPSKVSDYAWYPQPEDARMTIVPTNCTVGPSCPNYKDDGKGHCKQLNPLTPKYYEPDQKNPYYPMAPWAQLDQWLMNQVIPAKVYDPTGWDAQNPIHSSGIYVCGK